jgi:hypothetical protein
MTSHNIKLKSDSWRMQYMHKKSLKLTTGEEFSSTNVTFCIQTAISEQA